MTNASATKECFVIAPIGKENSEVRKRSDTVLKHIIEPALARWGYRALRADQISAPGVITTHIIEKLVEAPLVIADLSGRNPNVFYELGVRHAVKKPVIQIIEEEEFEHLPFDVASLRTIRFNPKDLGSAAGCIEQIIKYIEAVEVSQRPPDTPFSAALDSVLRKSRSTLVVATDAHYKLATALIRGAKESVILCQRTSTILLGPEKGRRPEDDFRRAIYDALDRNIPVYHLIHEESCYADVWRMPEKYDPALGHLPNEKPLYVGRYLGVKPVPRLLIVDQEVLGCVFDIDQTQYYEVVEAHEVSQAAQHLIRFITDKALDNFTVRHFFDRLKADREASLRIHQSVEGDEDIFARFFAQELRSKGGTSPQLNYVLSTGTSLGSIRVPLAWPETKQAVFFDPPILDNQVIEREHIWRSLNAASEIGWRCLFFSRNEMLPHIDEVAQHIIRFTMPSRN